jgi:hypothetical protein
MPHQARVLPSIMTADLRDELIHCRRGEDSRITIERHRERRCNVESRNLERDFESLAPAHERCPRRVLCDLLALHRALGVCGACTTSPDGGLAVQILDPPAGEVQRDGQPC